jgi:hypothetical protein
MDKQLQVYERFDRELRDRLKSLITDELIAEHEAKPLGPHSDELARVLNYFRRAPQQGKYLIVAVQAWSDYRIGVLPGVRGAPLEVLEEPSFPTEEEAMHGVFRKRVDDLLQA